MTEISQVNKVIDYFFCSFSKNSHQYMASGTFGRHRLGDADWAPPFGRQNWATDNWAPNWEPDTWAPDIWAQKKHRYKFYFPSKLPRYLQHIRAWILRFIHPTSKLDFVMLNPVHPSVSPGMVIIQSLLQQKLSILQNSRYLAHEWVSWIHIFKFVLVLITHVRNIWV